MTASTVPVPLTGHATDSGTQRFAARADAPQLFRQVGTQQWSRLGFGTYRTGVDNAEHADALKYAISHGVNVIDTSANYMDGDAETMIGQVVGDLVMSGGISRDEVVIVTKAGYIQGANMMEAQRREGIGRPFPEVVTYSENCWHCLHPEFLADQLSRSLARLNMTTLDTLLLHNPEYFLTDKKEHGGGVSDEDRREYERRLEAAFDWLQAQCLAGTIRSYGVSSNTFVVPSGDAEFTSLSACVEMAKRVAAKHGSIGLGGFGVVQMPGNLIERGFAMEMNQPDGSTALEVAEREGLIVLINRPLNAFSDEGLVRLADVPPAEPITEGEWLEALHELKATETQVVEESKLLFEDSPAGAEVRRLLRHASFLLDHWRSIRDREHWKQVVEHQLVPMAQFGLGTLNAAIQKATESATGTMMALPQRYLVGLDRVLKGGFRLYGMKSREEAQQRKLRVAATIADIVTAQATMSQMATALLLAQVGEPIVLMGMRHRSYVDDAMGAVDLLKGVDTEKLSVRLSAAGKGAE